MINQDKTPLELKFLKLPRFIEFERDIMPELNKAGITQDTFEQDQKTNPKNIPNERLLFYAELFNCHVSDLIELRKTDSSNH